MQRVQHARGWSFLPKVTFIITLGLITAATGFKAAAVDVFTDPVGFITLTAEGTTGPGVNPANSFLGLGMTAIIANRGAVSAIAGSDITVNNTLTAGAFAVGPHGPLFYIEFLNGANPGLTDDIVSNSTTDVFTANNDAAAIAGATLYKIYPHWTLNSVFGATDSAGLDAGSDFILVQNPLTQSFSTYFYSSSKGFGTGWRQTGQGSTDFGQTPLYNDQGVVVSRANSTNISFMLVGAVKIQNTLIPLSPANNFVGNVYATSAMTLSNSRNIDPLLVLPKNSRQRGAKEIGRFDTVSLSAGIQVTALIGRGQKTPNGSGGRKNGRGRSEGTGQRVCRSEFAPSGANRIAWMSGWVERAR